MVCDGYERKKQKTNKPSNLNTMKTKIFLFVGIVISLSLIFTSCEENDLVIDNQESILPEKFTVEIPSALTATDAAKKSSSEIDTLNGNVVYHHLGLFIEVGRSGAEIVEDIIKSIRLYNINEPMRFSYTSDDDGRTKNLVVMERSWYDGVMWEFELTITDAESEGNEDGGIGLQLFWNRNPRKGIALIKVANLDFSADPYFETSSFRIDYSEAGERGYDAYMIVSITDLPLEHPLVNPYSMKTLKMFVGKSGNTVDVYGNSDHPNAVFFSTQTGFNWAFAASGDNRLDIGAAEVGLPPSNLDEPSRDVLLGDYSVKNVFSKQIYNLWPTIDSTDVEAYLYNTAAPGYFDRNGFIQGGVSPGDEYDALERRLPVLTPYNPKEIHDLTIRFKLQD